MICLYVIKASTSQNENDTKENKNANSKQIRNLFIEFGSYFVVFGISLFAIEFHYRDKTLKNSEEESNKKTKYLEKNTNGTSNQDGLVVSFKKPILPGFIIDTSVNIQQQKEKQKNLKENNLIILKQNEAQNQINNNKKLLEGDPTSNNNLFILTPQNINLLTANVDLKIPITSQFQGNQNGGKEIQEEIINQDQNNLNVNDDNQQKIQQEQNGGDIIDEKDQQQQLQQQDALLNQDKIVVQEKIENVIQDNVQVDQIINQGGNNVQEIQNQVNPIDNNIEIQKIIQVQKEIQIVDPNNIKKNQDQIDNNTQVVNQEEEKEEKLTLEKQKQEVKNEKEYKKLSEEINKKANNQNPCKFKTNNDFIEGIQKHKIEVSNFYNKIAELEKQIPANKQIKQSLNYLTLGSKVKKSEKGKTLYNNLEDLKLKVLTFENNFKSQVYETGKNMAIPEELLNGCFLKKEEKK